MLVLMNSVATGLNILLDVPSENRPALIWISNIRNLGSKKRLSFYVNGAAGARRGTFYLLWTEGTEVHMHKTFPLCTETAIN